MKIFSVPLAASLSLAFATAPLASLADATLAQKGDIVGGKLQQSLSSKTAHNGDTFTMTEQDTFFHKNASLHGATIDGHVENVSPAGPTHKASMSVFFDDVKLADGSTVPLAAKVDSLSAPTHHIRDVGLILGGAIAGHMVGGKMGNHHGGLMGAGAGLALATTMKSDIKLNAGTVIKLKLLQPLSGSAPASM